jgi:hypothetical protein
MKTAADAHKKVKVNQEKIGAVTAGKEEVKDELEGIQSCVVCFGRQRG